MFEPGMSSSVLRNEPVVGPRRPETDALLLAAGSGDLDALAGFYDATAPTVLAMVDGVVHDPARTERVLEEVYLVLWRRAPAFDPAFLSAEATVLRTARQVLVGPVRDVITAVRSDPES